MWHKQEKIKQLLEPQMVVNEDRKEEFVNSLKMTKKPNKTKQGVTTLICNGDGLGIQKKISY